MVEGKEASHAGRKCSIVFSGEGGGRACGIDLLGSLKQGKGDKKKRTSRKEKNRHETAIRKRDHRGGNT